MKLLPFFLTLAPTLVVKASRSLRGNGHLEHGSLGDPSPPTKFPRPPSCETDEDCAYIDGTGSHCQTQGYCTTDIVEVLGYRVCQARETCDVWRYFPGGEPVFNTQDCCKLDCSGKRCKYTTCCTESVCPLACSN